MDKNIVNLHESDGTWLKVRKGEFAHFVQEYYGKRFVVLSYIMDNMDCRTNMFYGTIKQMSENLKISRPTVSKIIKRMESNGVLSLVQLGVWEVDISKAFKKKSS